MSRFAVLSARLLERRLLGDAERNASLIPGSFLTLTMSLFVFSLIVPGREPVDVARWLTFVCLVWSGVKAFLEADDLDAAAVDRAVLAPLPISPAMLAGARAVVVGAGLALSTLNVALPVVCIGAVVWGPWEALLLLLAAVLASLTGLALALGARVVLDRSLGGRAMTRLEGPIRLLVGISLFAVVFVTPDLSALASSSIVGHLPPFSFAELVAGEKLLSSIAGAVVALAVLLTSLSLARDGGRRAVTSRAKVAAPVPGRLQRLFVRDDERAGYEFAGANISRDRTFRARSYPLFAFPFAVTILLVRQPDEPTLALLALYGAAVYLSVAQMLFPYSESPGGAALFQTLPIRDHGAYRAGSEKAFLVGVALPIYVALTVALMALALFDRGFPVLVGLAHAFLGALCAAIVIAILFTRIPELAFSCADEGTYAKDMGGPMGAIMLAAILAVFAVPAAADPLRFAAVAVMLIVALKVVFATKRRRVDA